MQCDVLLGPHDNVTGNNYSLDSHVEMWVTTAGSHVAFLLRIMKSLVSIGDKIKFPKCVCVCVCVCACMRV